MIVCRGYRRLLALFPPDFREHCRDEAAATFEQLWNDAGTPTEQWRIALLACGRLPWALTADWTSYLTHPARRAEGTLNRSTTMALFGTGNLRHALRALRKSPAFTISTVSLLALGIGAVTTIFTLVDQILLRPLPYPDGERLITVEEGAHSGPLFRAMQELDAVEQWAAAQNTMDVNLVGEGTPQKLRETRVSADFFDLLGARPSLGRLLAGEDFLSGTSIVLSDGAWRRVWGADPEIVGRTVRIDGEPSTIVGILAPSFSPPEAVVGRGVVDLWRPVNWSDPGFASHERWSLNVVGRLRPGVTPLEADAEVVALMERMAPIHDNYKTEAGLPRSIPVALLSEATVRGVRAGLGLLFGAVALLLLVACANVAHLFLARGIGRQREMAIRRALGAGTPTLTGQLLAECLVVGTMGGLIGLVLASAGLRAFLALNPETLPRESAVSVDAQILLFAALVSLATVLVFGLAPALKAVGGRGARDLHGPGRTSTAGRGIHVLRSGLIVAEVALSLVLVASAGLLLRSFRAVQAQDPGFQISGVWTVPLTPREAGTPDEYRRSMGEVRQALSEVPGVEFATYGLTLPLEMAGGGRCCWRSNVTGGDESIELSPWFHPVSEEFFETLTIPILHGRSWTTAEATTTPFPVVVSEQFAVRMFGASGRAINREITRGESSLLILGVAGNTKHYGLDADEGPAIYLPIEQMPFAIPQAHMAVKMAAPSGAGLARRLRDAVWSASPDLPIPVVRPMADWLDLGNARRRFDSALFGSFGLVALLLAAGGLYGTLLYMAGQRRRELAIRLALGASSKTIERWMLRGGIWVATVGIALGLAGSWGTARFLESRLWGVKTTDPVALFGAAALLLLVASVASWLPARRAGLTDPLETLKAE